MQFMLPNINIRNIHVQTNEVMIAFYCSFKTCVRFLKGRGIKILILLTIKEKILRTFNQREIIYSKIN